MVSIEAEEDTETIMKGQKVVKKWSMKSGQDLSEELTEVADVVVSLEEEEPTQEVVIDQEETGSMICLNSTNKTTQTQSKISNNMKKNLWTGWSRNTDPNSKASWA